MPPLMPVVPESDIAPALAAATLRHTLGNLLLVLEAWRASPGDRRLNSPSLLDMIDESIAGLQTWRQVVQDTMQTAERGR